MRSKYLFSNLIGTFVFNEHFNIIKAIMFRNIEEYNAKGKYEKEFLKKYKNSKKPDEKESRKILGFFKKKEYFKEFYNKNLILTKRLIKESVKEDVLINQAINNIADIDRVINTLVKRLRDWYGLYNPEFSHSIQKHEKFIEMILKRNKKDLLEEIRIDERDSMGADLSKEDLAPVMNLAAKIKDLFELREEQEGYLGKIMENICPNMLAITGVTIGAKLIAKAGSLRRLVEFPASTIQLLGAEKALFRHIKTKSKSPRYGYLREHPLIMQNKRELHGKIARALADKISIAVKVDYFKGRFVGNELRRKLEDRFKNKTVA